MSAILGRTDPIAQVTPRYYESHVTLEPVFGERLELAREISERHGFKVADLLMVKTALGPAARSDKDTFTTGRSKTFEDLHCRMSRLESDLSDNGFQVWRAKIEAVIFDQRYRRNGEPALSSDA